MADDVLGSTASWSKLAEQIHADVKEQPKMLTGGELRDYQMQASRLAGSARQYALF